MSFAAVNDSQRVPAGTAGTLQAVFAPPPLGTVMVVAFVIPNAEATASWGLYIGTPPGQLLGTWNGNTPYSQIPLQPDIPVAVVGAGLTAGKAYVLNRVGYAIDADQAAVLNPLPPAPGGATLIVPPPPTGGGSSSGGGTGPPAPSTGGVVASNLGVSVDNTGTSQIINVSGLLSYTISNPEGNPSVWIARVPFGAGGVQASVNHGIELPSPSFLYDDQWHQQVFGISTGASVTLGVSYLTAT